MLDLITGKGANLASIKSPLSAKVPDGAILVARAVGLEKTNIGEHLKFFRLIKGFEYVAAETGGKWKENLTVTADSEPVAENLRRALDGLLARMELCFHDQPKLVGMMRSAEITRSGSTVQASYEGAADEVAAQVKPALEAMREEWKSRLSLVQSLLGENAPNHAGSQSDK